MYEPVALDYKVQTSAAFKTIVPCPSFVQHQVLNKDYLGIQILEESPNRRRGIDGDKAKEQCGGVGLVFGWWCHMELDRVATVSGEISTSIFRVEGYVTWEGSQCPRLGAIQ